MKQGTQTEQPKIGRINVRLVREHIKNPIDAIVPKKRKQLRLQTPNNTSPPMWLFVRETPREPTPWIGFLNGHFEEQLQGPQSIAQSALLFIKVDNRLFVLTFGAGSQALLKSDAVTYDFGYDVTNKTLDPTAITNIESCVLEGDSMRTAKQKPSGTLIGGFGLDYVRDNVRALSGKTKDEKHGKRLSGRQSLISSQSVTLEDIVKRCRKWLAAYQDETKMEIWSNSVERVTDPVLIQKLDDLFLKKIQTSEPGVVIGIPEVYNVEVVEGFKFSNSKDGEVGFDLTFKDYLERHRNPRQCTIDLLRSDKILGRNADEGRYTYQWSVWECLEMELRYASQTYLLHGGQWHQIPDEVTSRIDKVIDDLQNADLILPNASSKETEGKYNERASSLSGLTLMDREIMRGPGYASGIEVCDLLDLRKKMFVHIKRGTDSSSLSHLFRQGITSAKMFLLEDDLKNKVSKHLNAKHDRVSVERFMKADDHVVVFGFMTPKEGSWSKILPFFSKLSLYEAVRELKTMRYGVQMLRIEQKNGVAQTIRRRKSVQPEVG